VKTYLVASGPYTAKVVVDDTWTIVMAAPCWRRYVGKRLANFLGCLGVRYGGFDCHLIKPDPYSPGPAPLG
jgi:hypothetical protein